MHQCDCGLPTCCTPAPSSFTLAASPHLPLHVPPPLPLARLPPRVCPLGQALQPHPGGDLGGGAARRLPHLPGADQPPPAHLGIPAAGARRALLICRPKVRGTEQGAARGHSGPALTWAPAAVCVCVVRCGGGRLESVSCLCSPAPPAPPPPPSPLLSSSLLSFPLRAAHLRLRPFPSPSSLQPAVSELQDQLCEDDGQGLQGH